MKKLQPVSILFLVCVITFQPLLVAAQLQTGRFTGMVTDEEGHPLPGASLSIAGDSLSRTSVTDAEGKFSFTALPPGDYEVSASFDGFNTVVAPASVAVNEETKACLALTLAAVTEELIVTAESPIQDNTSPGASELINLNDAFSQLPVARTYIDGLQDGEKFLGMDRFFDAGTNLVEGITNRGNLYVINEQTGDTTPIGTVPLPSGTSNLGFDYDPITKKFRLGFGVKNLEYDLFTSQARTGTDFHYASNDRNAGRAPDVVGLAFDKIFSGAMTNTLYGIDANNDCLFTSSDPDSGEIRTVKRFNFPITDACFDINAGDYAKMIFPVGNASFIAGLYLGSVGDTAGDSQELETTRYSGVITAATFAESQYSDKQFCLTDSPSERKPLNGSRSIATTVVSEGQPLTGQAVSFRIIDGPNEGIAVSRLTDTNGRATFTYSNNGQKGTDTIIVASSLLGQGFTCAASTIWTDGPIITDADIKANLNKVTIKGFNFLGLSLVVTINGQTVKFAVKNDNKIVAKKTRNAIGDCSNSPLMEIFAQGFESGNTCAFGSSDTSAFATCP